MTCTTDNTLWNPALDDDPGFCSHAAEPSRARPEAPARMGRVLAHGDGSSGGVVYGDPRTVESVVELLKQHGFRETASYA